MPPRRSEPPEPKPTVLLYCEATDWEATYVATRLRHIAPIITATPLRGEAALPAGAEQADVLSVSERSTVDRALLDRLPRLRLLLVRALSLDRVDRTACAERGVLLRLVSGEAEYTAAEHTLALLLALSRRLALAPDDRSGEAAMPGWELRGKSLGIVGLGRVGRRVAHLAMAFEMQVLATDVRPDVARAEAVGLHLMAPEDFRHWVVPVSPQDVVATVRVVPLDDLLSRADVISLHLPVTDQTRHLLDAAALARIKPGAILINTAHAALVDPAALRAALADGTLAGAGLDALEDEAPGVPGPVPPEGPAVSRSDYEALRQHPNVILSDHAAGHSEDVIRRRVIVAVELVARFMEGQPIEGAE